MHDDLDTADRKLSGIKSVWGVPWKRKKHDRNIKHRGDYERERAQRLMDVEQMRLAQQDEDDEATRKDVQRASAAVTHDAELARERNRQERADRKELKLADKRHGEFDSAEGTRFRSGDFIFEERDDGFGERCQAEEDLDTIQRHVEGLKTVAWTIGERIDEGDERLTNIQSEMDRADARTKKNIERGNKIMK